MGAVHLKMSSVSVPPNIPFYTSFNFGLICPESFRLHSWFLLHLSQPTNETLSLFFLHNNFLLATLLESIFVTHLIVENNVVMMILYRVI